MADAGKGGKKKGNKGPKGGEKGTVSSSTPATGGQLSEKMESMSLKALDKNAMSLFPRRPARKPGTKPPGTTVRLISNLFRLCFNNPKPIYCYSIKVDLVESSTTPTKKSEEAGDKEEDTSTGSAKFLSRQEKREVIKKAIIAWAKNQKLKQPHEFSYVPDGNFSYLYALFDIFVGKPNTVKDMDLPIVEIDVDAIVEKKVIKQSKKFLVNVKKVRRLDIRQLLEFCRGTLPGQNIADFQEHLRALNVILRGEILTITNNLCTPLNVFPFTNENQFSVSSTVLINKGYSTSVRPTESGMVINIANTVGAFYKPIELIEILKSFDLRIDLNRPLKGDMIARLEREVKNKKVEAIHINYGKKTNPHYRTYRVGKIEGSCKDKFMLVDKVTKESREITIKEYFKKEYNYTLKYPELPCVIDKGRKIPIEVCRLVDRQRVLRKMDPNETAEIIKKAALPPLQHFKQIESNVQDIHSHKGPLVEFGLDFDVRPIETDGRELPPICLMGGSKRSVLPNNGEYNVRGDSFFRPTLNIKKWVLAFIMDRFTSQDYQRNNGHLNETTFSEYYCQGARKKGINVSPMVTANFINVQDESELRKTLQKYFIHLNESGHDHAIIVLPKQCPDWVYRYIQFLEATIQCKRQPGKAWCRTSCIKYDNYKRKIVEDRSRGEMFISNLWLKYNTKFGGINFVLDNSRTNFRFLQDGYIFISVDVCHPAPGDKLIQSVAAVVGMWDLTNNNMSYCTKLTVQKKQRENHSTIEDVGEIGTMIGAIIEQYKAKKKVLPKNIVILRDGVSEGQFKIVLESELTRVFKTLAQKYGGESKLPPSTCLVVQKRHKVRFIRKDYILNRKDEHDYNIQPGTVVDKDVVHPTDFAFYLAPHRALQGTSRAAHIYVIYDDNKFTQDEAQAMIHALSYLSPRCTKSTSIPTPVNLADLAAEQGKNIVISWNDNFKGKLSDEERLKKLNDVLKNLGDANYMNTLFYI